MLTKEVINALKTLATEDRRKTNEWFLRQNYAQIPRTTLRYAIKPMDKEERLLYLKGNFDVSD